MVNEVSFFRLWVGILLLGLLGISHPAHGQAEPKPAPPANPTPVKKAPKRPASADKRVRTAADFPEIFGTKEEKEAIRRKLEQENPAAAMPVGPVPTGSPVQAATLEFKVAGPAAVAYARKNGFQFTPKGGKVENGKTVASQVPKVITSSVDGARMRQYRPLPLWSIKRITNTFYMFAGKGNTAKPLARGWRIGEVKLKGSDDKQWAWSHKPKRGAGSAFFSVDVHGVRGKEPATEVSIETITLVGPPGATDWHEAFRTGR